MSLELALRLSEIMLGLAFIQQSAEHLSGPRDEKKLFALRITLSFGLILGVATQWIGLGLILLGAIILRRFQGPYNGGCDRMSLLILICLTLTHFLPPAYQEYAFGYLALQLVLSYFISGQVKICNAEWRSGAALRDVFLFSNYPVSLSLRKLSERPKLLLAASWAVMLFELAFPFALMTQTALIIALAIAALFHLANAILFGLNRFFWIWLCAYPSIIWLQERAFNLG